MLHHPCILGDPQRHGEQNQNWCRPQLGGNATSPLHSRGSPKNMGDKIGIRCAHKWAEMLHHPCILGDLQKTWGTKSELVGPTSGRKCYITPAFSGIPKDMGDKIRIGRAHKWAEMLHHPCILGVPKNMGDKIRFGVAHNWAEMLHHPCILGDPQRHEGQNQNWWGPQVGGNATSPLHSRGSPTTWGTKSDLGSPTIGRKCYITLAFSGIPKDMGDKIRIGGAHKWAEMLHHPCILVGPQRHGGQNQISCRPQLGGNATSALHSRGSPKTWGTKSKLVGPTSGRKCHITSAFSGVPKDMGDKIRIGVAHKWAEMLHHPCILGDPQRHGGQNQNWWGPQVGGNATSPLHSRGSPKTWGTK